MVNLTRAFSPSLLNELFYSWPTETKPPIVWEAVVKDDVFEGVKIQMALAGFREEDLRVEGDNIEKKIYISGDNTGREDIIGKFKSKFKHTIVCSHELSLADENVEVGFKDGMLNIFLPAAAKNTSRTLLLGNSE